MRTKVERKQRVLEEKLKLNMPSPKVVLDASDCARLLDGAGKTSVVVVEREGKIVAASSVTGSSDVVPSVTSSAPAPTPPLKSASTSEQPEPRDSALAPAQPTTSNEQPIMCESFSGSYLAKDNEKSRKKESMLSTDKDGLAIGRKTGSDQNKAILKPPKKRRGIEVDFEIETSSQSVLKNGDPQLPSPNQLNNENNFSNSAQRHSVERILQQNSVVSSQSHHDLPHSQSILSAGMELAATSTAQTSVPSTSSHESQPLSSSDQIHHQHHPYPSLVLQSKRATQNQSLPKNSPCNSFNHENASGMSTPNGDAAAGESERSFRLSPEQDEPINLSTSSQTDKTVVSPVTSQAGITTPAEGCKPDLTAHVTSVSSGDGQQTNPKITPGILLGSISSHVSDIPQKQIRSAADTLNPSNHTDYETGALAQTPLLSHLEGSKIPHLPTSQDHEHSDNPCAPPTVDPPCNSVCKDKDEPKQGLCVETCGVANKTCSLGPENNPTESPKLNANDVLVSKSKKSSKKKTEIPMDDASCAQRLTQYALTIDDVIANFVYVPEPVEEIRLTEEEELALRDQFGEAEDPCHTIKDTNLSSTSSNNGVNVCDSAKAEPKAISVSPTVQSAETQTTIYPSKSLLKNQPSEPKKDMQVDQGRPNQTSSNIDSVLAAVASDVSKHLAKVSREVSVGDKVKKKKKTKISMKEAETEGENSILSSKKPNKELKEPKHQSLDSIQHQKNIPEDVEKQPVIKSFKPKKAEKRKSSEKSSDLGKAIINEEQHSGGPLKKKKKIVKKSKPESDVDKCSKIHSVPVADTSPEVAPGLLDVGKDFLGANKTTETSDIGESIASTSGGSEQDTPIHESELISGKLSQGGKNDPVDKDKDSPDTGLESSGGEDSLNKPVRRYKKRLDFVKCDQCEHQARGRSALSRHMKKVHQVEVDMPHKCPHCSYGCSKQASLNRHLFTHGVFSCSRCSFVGETRLALTQHVLENHRDKLDLKLCKICNRYIKCDQVTIEEHTSKCQGPTPYKCTVCEKVFKYGSSLRVHYHTHFPDQPKKFKCELCEYRTNYKANLHKHHKNMHAVKGREFQCPDCGKLFATEDNMRRHRKVHTLARPFACETCKKTFKTSGALKGHQLIHTATRPYTCNITGCNRSFRTPKFLKSHQEEFHRLVPKKFFCSVDGCNYSFFKRSHLKRHAITHTGERNFHCTWPGCSKSFRHSDNLKVHFRSHTTEKIFQCHLCDFKTKQKNSMFWHKKKVHQIVESSKANGATHSSSGAKSKPEKVEPASGQAHSETPSGPDVVESGCQTALAMSEHSEDGSLIEGPARGKDSLTCTEEVKHSDALSKVESLKAERVKAQPDGADGKGSKDLYEFKSDDESEDETPGSFRRDLIPKEELTPLPPAPRELLIKNEIEEQRELARKEREQKKELEKKEKMEKREQEKKERAEKKEMEKKEKIEKKEMEKKEKIEKKELEKKEKIEKKELEKKEKEEKKELEKKEKKEKKEMEKKEKMEQKELEKKEKAEKKEQERKERLEKKELEMKEKIEKREKEKLEKEQAKLDKEKVKKEREEERKAREQLKLEKEKEREWKKAGKENVEREVTEEKENEDAGMDEPEKKKMKPGNKSQKKAGDNTSDQHPSSGTEGSSSQSKLKKHRPEERAIRRKSPARGISKKPKVLARKKSPRRLSLKLKEEDKEEEEKARQDKPKRGRKKKLPEMPVVTKVMNTRKKKLNEEAEPEVLPLKKKKMSKKPAEDTNNTAVSPRSPRSSPRAAVVGRRQSAGRVKKAGDSPGKKSKGLPITRKMSARIQARAQPMAVKKAKVVKGRKGAKPGPKKKVVEKKELPIEEAVQAGEEDEKENISVKEEEDVSTKSAAKNNAEKTKESKVNAKKEKESTKKKIEVKKISTRRRTAAEASKDNGKTENSEESIALPERPESPAYSEELMLQGNASPYRDFSDADNINEDEEKEESENSKEVEADTAKSPVSNSEVLSQDGRDDHTPSDEQRNKNKEEDVTQGDDSCMPHNLQNAEQPKKDEDSGGCQNEDAYSSDDDVSNDIPLTPPRAPAPPPVESSEDEMEEAGEPDTSAPFSVPGPNTPFSVPGPNTPFSVPGPHTPFSVPPPTNLMQQQHSVPSEDTPLSTVPSVQSTEMHSHSSVELQHSLGSVEMQPSQNSVEMHQAQGSVEMHQAHGSVEMHPSQSSTEMHSHNSSGEINHSSVDMHISNSSREMSSRLSGEMHSHGSAEGNHLQGTVQMQPNGGSVDMHSHRSLEIYPHDSAQMRQEGSYELHSEASTLQKLRDEAMNSVKPPESADITSVSDKYQFPHHIVESLGKYNFPHPLPDHSHSDADKAYFDQYLKNLSSTRGGLNSGMGSSPTGLQQLEAMVGKSHIDGGPKSPVSSLPSSVITSLESGLAGDGRSHRGEALPHPHEALYSGRETPSALPRLPDRQSTNTPLPPSGAPTPAFEAFSHLNPLHAAPPTAPVPGRDNAYLRQADNLFPTPPVSSSFMAEAMFQRQAMSTPFLPPPPPQAGERSSVLTSHSSSSTLLRRAGTMPTSDMFSASQAMQPTMSRNPFTNAWASQDSRPSHWQTPYLPRQSNMATPGTFFPGKESYLTGREFMFDPTSVRASAEGRSMFPSLSGSSQGQESLPLDRFDLSNYFPNAAAMAPYGSSAAATSLDYTRTGHTSSSKPFDDRYRQASVSGGATSGAIPDFRSLPAVSGSGSEMFPGIPGVNPGFNLYAAAGNPMSYHPHHHHHHPHSQHPHHHQLTDSSVNSAFLSHHHHPHHHPGSAQHAAMFERDYRGLYPQNAAAAAAAAYPFINERQYPASTSKLGHTHPSVGPSASASSRATAQEGQMQDPYRTMLYRY